MHVDAHEVAAREREQARDGGRDAAGPRERREDFGREPQHGRHAHEEDEPCAGEACAVREADRGPRRAGGIAHERQQRREREPRGSGERDQRGHQDPHLARRVAGERATGGARPWVERGRGLFDGVEIEAARCRTDDEHGAQQEHVARAVQEERAHGALDLGALRVERDEQAEAREAESANAAHTPSTRRATTSIAQNAAAASTDASAPDDCAASALGMSSATARKPASVTATRRSPVPGVSMLGTRSNGLAPSMRTPTQPSMSAKAKPPRDRMREELHGDAERERLRAEGDEEARPQPRRARERDDDHRGDERRAEHPREVIVGQGDHRLLTRAAP